MAPTSSVGSLEKPMNVEQIVQIAAAQQTDSQFSILHYFRSAELMVKQANIYEHEGNDQMTYFLLYRHATLVLDTLPSHSQAKDPIYNQRWTSARKAVSRNLKKMELLKPRINSRYDKHLQRRAKLAMSQGASNSSQSSRKPLMGYNLDNAVGDMTVREEDSSAYSSAMDFSNHLDPAEHRDMAVQMANREIGRRSQKHQTSSSRADLASTENDEEIRQRMTNTRQQTELSQGQTPPPPSDRRRLSSSKPFKYPTVPKHADHDEGELWLPSFTSIKHQPPPPRPQKQPNPPQKPPKELPPASSSSTYQQPSTFSTTSPPPIPSKVAPSPPPSPTPTHQFLPSAYLENGTPLRTIFLPSGLRNSFLQIAHRNTQLNLETCGILCGTLLRNAFFITRLVIPEQTSTSDTCEMVNEEALHAYVDSPQPRGEELMVLGWIHTHPTQTAFMSSRDLHTHCWYQVQLPESIAIVCAPSKSPAYGIFRLTDPPGMETVRKCTKPGIFHPHDETHVFTDAGGRPGHVIEHSDLKFETVDLRPPG